MGNQLELLIEQQRLRVRDGISVAYRIDRLKKLRQRIAASRPAIIAALRADLQKPEQEAYVSEIVPLLTELGHAIRKLASWAKPRRVRTPSYLPGGSSRIYYEPYGAVLILSPWNYPFTLSLWPLIGAVAAGNAVILKPSELAPASSALLRELVADVFEPGHVCVIEGDGETGAELLRHHFDYIFFTGSASTGKKVLAAASDFLTPVTLELGGKSPCLVHEDACLKTAAKRIVWGKFMNAGQTCVAPDYVLVHRSVHQALVAELKREIAEQYGAGAHRSGTTARIINRRHMERLLGYLNDGRILAGGGYDAGGLRLEPTLLEPGHLGVGVMQDEIFGPILPIWAYDDVGEAKRIVATLSYRALALYVFTQSRRLQRELLQTVPFGGGCINDTVAHTSSVYLPFGGTGTSGMGSYRGRQSFLTFSHSKSVLRQPVLLDNPLRYRPVKTWVDRFWRFL